MSIPYKPADINISLNFGMMLKRTKLAMHDKQMFTSSGPTGMTKSMDKVGIIPPLSDAIWFIKKIISPWGLTSCEIMREKG